MKRCLDSEPSHVSGAANFKEQGEDMGVDAG